MNDERQISAPSPTKPQPLEAQTHRARWIAGAVITILLVLVAIDWLGVYQYRQNKATIDDIVARSPHWSDAILELDRAGIPYHRPAGASAAVMGYRQPITATVPFTLMQRL